MIRSKRINRRQLILIVDDQEINRDALGVILEDDYDLLYAENGQEALEIMPDSKKLSERLEELQDLQKEQATTHRSI